MDRHSAMQGVDTGTGAAAQEWEWFYASGGQPAAEQGVVVDRAFLMELLADAPVTEQAPEDVDRLSHVIRSLEAEIGGGARPPLSAPEDGESTAEHVAGDDVISSGALEEYYLLSDLDTSIVPGAYCVSEPPLEYWMEVPAAVVEHDMCGWYVDGEGAMVGGYELREQCYYGYSESPHVEHVYSPLWE
ncbi:hypothetical protein HU200_011402 [Digitaria exilis]|uniref:Uncharacterized protein n=1 Tax=Digitaria exilis TaxID=1010633 RepID=A0A835KMQ1_9POAL|nr:hypothetical protein HU200_011402 [Digitaria exilis]